MKLIEYLPEVIRPYLEFIEIMKAEQTQKDQVWTDLDTVLNQRYVGTMGAEVVGKWEDFLGLSRNSDAPMEVRKGNIRAKFQESPPYTWETLISSLNSICGENGYTIEHDFDNYTIQINLRLAYLQAIPMIETLVERIVPANFDVTIAISYNRWGRFRTETWGTLQAHDWQDIILGEEWQEE